MSEQNYCTVVTGAAGGIGAAVVAKCRAAGAQVVAVGRDAARLADAFGGDTGVTCLACDVTTEAGFAALTDLLSSRFAGVAGFVHAAGHDRPAPLGLVTSDAVGGLFAVHAAFPLRFLGWMARRGRAAPGAAAVLVSSCAAHEGAQGHAAYAAAKGAVEGFLRPAAAELAPKGVRLNAVVLGVVRTAMSEAWLAKLTAAQRAALEAAYPLGFGKPEQAAAAIAFLLSSAADWITGQTLVCDGGHALAAGSL